MTAAMVAVLIATPGASAAPPEQVEPACTPPYGQLPSARWAPPLDFGIYPGGFAGGGSEAPVPNDPAQIERALRTLQGGARRFLVRAYSLYHDAPSDGDPAEAAPADFAQYVRGGRKLDLVLQYAADTGNLDGWERFVRDAVRRYGPDIETLSVTLEANTANEPVQRQALIRGVHVAKRTALRRGLWRLQVGFDTVNFGVPFDTAFWTALREEGGSRLGRELDYVGVDLYAGVFTDVAPTGQPGDRADVVTLALKMTRNCSMRLAGLGRALPIRVSENGWPLFGDRTEQQQADALRTTVTTIDDLRAELGILSYEAFALRDGLTSSDNLFDHFGLMRDDYSPKPAFGVYRDLIAALSRPMHGGR